MITVFLEKYSICKSTYHRNKLNDYLRRSHSDMCFCGTSASVTYFDCPLVHRSV